MTLTNRMTPRLLGDSGLAVSPIGLGLAALGRPGYITLDHAADLMHDYSVDAMQARTHALLDQAWAAGVRYFDAARSYGHAEVFLGTWLQSRDFGDAPPVVGSKWGYTYTAGWQVTAEQHEIKEHTLPVLQRQWQESRQWLGNFLRLYQIHSATFESGVLRRADVLTELAWLKAAGICIGITLSGPDQAAVLAAAQTITVDGVRLFDSVQGTWNLLEPSCGAALTAAQADGMGVIVKEALANGRLTPRNDSADFAAKRATLEQIATRHGATLDALALAAALAQPWAGVVLSGAVTAAQLAANLMAPAVMLTHEELAELAWLAEAPTEYWAKRSALPWN
jgi:aryl-alcohol dehydrogenase-like predicted oxidoreductase